MNIRFFILILITITACNRKATTTITDNPPPKVEIPAEKTEIEPPATEPVLPVSNLPQAILSFSRTPCYGKCPVYEARFMSDGRVTWLGKKNTERVGHYEAFIERDQLNLLQQQIKNSQFQTWQPTYPTNADKMITDLPQTITKVQVDGQVVQVINNYDAPQSLTVLENFVKTQLDKLAWRKIE